VNNIILSFIFSSFIILVWLLIWCSQGWSNISFDLTNFFFSSLSCLRHLLNNNVLYFTCLVLCCFLWSWRSQVEGVKLKFKGLKYEVIVSGLKFKSLVTLLGFRFESLVTLLSLSSLCHIKGHCVKSKV
jgi:hypothetical protein